ncbi:hypothetical protein [Rhodococcus sovatensis]|uniref:Uncharacterized protein n=1 Tax=Rhodococcus sovatensis TaxID=1805840 RepID=A0ABZ2PQW4_9NOCA
MPGTTLDHRNADRLGHQQALWLLALGVGDVVLDMPTTATAMVDHCPAVDCGGRFSTTSVVR